VASAAVGADIHRERPVRSEYLGYYTSQSRNVLEELQQILDKNSKLSSENGSVGKRIKRVWKRLNWKLEDIDE
jgi:hypothetical protein